MNQMLKLAIPVMLLMMCISLSSAQSIETRAEDGGALPTNIPVDETFTVLITEGGNPVGADTKVVFTLPAGGGVPIYSLTDESGKARYKPLITGTLGIRVLDDDLVTVANATVNVTTTDIPVVSIGSATCSVGGTVDVPISITGASGIGAIDITVDYDASILTATGVANGTMIEGMSDLLWAYNLGAGRVNISFATYPDMINGDGELFVVTFAAGAAGNSTLDIMVKEAWTGDVPPQPVTPITVDGYVNVTSTTPPYDPADTNHDCVVDMMELMAHISKWKSGEVGMMELTTSIGRWKLGSGGYC